MVGLKDNVQSAQFLGLHEDRRTWEAKFVCAEYGNRKITGILR